MHSVGLIATVGRRLREASGWSVGRPRPGMGSSVRAGVAAATAASLLLAAVGCSGKPQQDNPNQPSTITMFGASNPQVKNMDTDWATKFVEKKFDLNIKWTLSTDATTKQPLLFASGNYPDVIVDGTFTNVQLEQYGSQQHILLPLNDLLKKYAPNAWKAIQTRPGYKEQIMAPDGKIYGLPLYNYCFHCDWPYNFYINAALLNKYGLSMPKTTADFAHVLQVFHQHGVAAPLTGSVTGILPGSQAAGYNIDVITFLMNAFTPYNGNTNYFSVSSSDSKALTFAPTRPEWKQGLEYLHQLYQAGGFSNSVFTQQDTAVQNLISKNQVGVVPNGAIQTIVPNWGEKGSGFDQWVPLAPLTGPSGVRNAAFGGVPGGVTGQPAFAITNKASDLAQQRVMKLLNYLYTPTGTQTIQFGPEGKFWTKAKPGVQGLIPQQAMFNTDWAAFNRPNSVQNEGWAQWGPQDQSFQWRELNHQDPAYSANGGEALDQLVEAAEYAGLQPRWQYGSPWVSVGDAQTYSTLQTNINNYVGQWTVNFIVGKKSLTSDWSAYLSGLKQLNLNQYVSMTTKSSVGPFDTNIPTYQAYPGDVKYLLTQGPVPPLVKKYMIQDGVPAADFTK